MTRDLNLKETESWIVSDKRITNRVMVAYKLVGKRHATKWLADMVKQSGWRRAGITEQQAGSIVDKIVQGANYAEGA